MGEYAEEQLLREERRMTDPNIYRKQILKDQLRNQSTKSMEKTDTALVSVNTGTGEIAPIVPQNVSMLKLTDEECTKLDAYGEPPPEQISFKDGLAYLPQVFYRDALNQVFGFGQWALLEVATDREQKGNFDVIYFRGHLYVRGCYVASACGEAKYFFNNGNSTYATAWESAKSDCITRCCKDLGIARKLWDKKFTDGLKKGNTPQSAGTGVKTSPAQRKPPQTANNGAIREAVVVDEQQAAVTDTEVAPYQDQIDHAESKDDLKTKWATFPLEIKNALAPRYTKKLQSFNK
jgi:hypothetical protein